MFHIILINQVLDVITFLAYSFSYKSRDTFTLIGLVLVCYPVSFTALIFYTQMYFFLPISSSCKAQSFSKDLSCDPLILVFPFALTSLN